MRQIDELTLMAYADGELDRQEAHRVERAMETDASLRAELQSYRRSTDLMQKTYGPIATEPCPSGISAAIGGLPYPADRIGATLFWLGRRRLPLAASIAAAAAIVALVLFLQGPAPGDSDTIMAIGPDQRSVPATRGSDPMASADTRAVASKDANDQNIIRIGSPVPDIAFITVDGRVSRLSEFRGRPVMLWLFATWCRTCRAATVAVAENYDRLHQAGLQIIQLKLHENLGYPGPTTEEFAAQYAGSLSSVPGWLWGDASKAGSFAYNPNGFTEIYCLIDRDGILRDVAQAPNVTMQKIETFARVNTSVGGS